MKSVLLVCLLTSVYGRQGFGPTEQEWGYVTVREGAHMFWWLHQTSANVSISYTERPLVIWLQGGPGGSSTGYGNFGELGPLDSDLNPRNTTWINDVNVLFVDNPVGCGFSYADSTSQLATNNRQIAEDFLVLMRGFFETLPELKQTPLYIFCESYGGKMTTEIALVLNEAIQSGSLEANLVGIALGDSWISPMDSIRAYAPYVLNLGVVDQEGYEEIATAADMAITAINNGEFATGTVLWDETLATISNLTYGMNVYNILTKIPAGQQNPTQKFVKTAISEDEQTKIEIIMNTKVKEALGLNVTWLYLSDGVYNALAPDMMTSVTNIVELLLNTTNVKVAVYNGQLDLIVGTPGTVQWIDELKFIGSEEWASAARNPLIANGIIEGYYKKVGNLAMYWVDRAGHMVPTDNPSAMHFILSDVTNGFINEVKH